MKKILLSAVCCAALIQSYANAMEPEHERVLVATTRKVVTEAELGDYICNGLGISTRNPGTILLDKGKGLFAFKAFCETLRDPIFSKKMVKAQDYEIRRKALQELTNNYVDTLMYFYEAFECNIRLVTDEYLTDDLNSGVIQRSQKVFENYPNHEP